MEKNRANLHWGLTKVLLGKKVTIEPKLKNE